MSNGRGGGVFKKYIGGLAFESIQTSQNDGRQEVIPCKSTDGNEYDNFLFAGLNNSTLSQMFSAYKNLKVEATADKLDDYDLMDYQVESIGTTTYSTLRYIGRTFTTLAYSVNIANNSDSDIRVTCIKFIKTATFSTSSTSIKKDILLCGYYLNEPLVVPVSGSKVVTIEMKIGVDIQ